VHTYIGESLTKIQQLCERSEKQAFLDVKPKDPGRIRRTAEAECEHLVEEYVILATKGHTLVEEANLPKEDVLEIINIIKLCWKNIEIIEENCRRIIITMNKVITPISHKPYNPYERGDLP
jgi:hypothetical protein